VQQWDVFELTLRARQAYGNPFRDVGVRATFRHAASGESVTVDGFHDGDDVWRVRFMPARQGVWAFRTESADPGLDGAAGTLRCVPPRQRFLHGPLRAEGHHFRHADGTYRFLLSTRLTCQDADPRTWRAPLDFLTRHRINRVLFMMIGVCSADNEASRRGFFGGESPDWPYRYNVTRFRAIDAFVRALRARDIIASPYLYYFNMDTMKELLEGERARQYVRYAMARLGSFCNVLAVLSNEVEKATPLRNERRQAYDLGSRAWANEIGPFLRELAVYGQAVTVHNPMENWVGRRPSYFTEIAKWEFPWADCMLRQIQVGALGSARTTTDDDPEPERNGVYNVRAFARHNQLLVDLRRYGVPVVNDEPGYQSLRYPDIPSIPTGSILRGPGPLSTGMSQTSDTLRGTFWTALAAGAYAMWGSRSAYRLRRVAAGLHAQRRTARWIRVLGDFMADVPYWTMAPDNDLVSAAAISVDMEPYRTNFCLARRGAIYLVYSMLGGTVTLDLGDGAYDVLLLDPVTGRRRRRPPVAGGRREIALAEGEQVALLRRRSGAVRRRGGGGRRPPAERPRA
jgi:hypothetical protein